MDALHSDLQRVICKLKDDPQSLNVQSSTLKTILSDIADFLILSSSMIGNVIVKEAVYGLGVTLKMIANHMN